ncbi:ABC transporter substrate-binding protein (plasmid) [Photobacterium damselae]|uniref:ABC transporter substrate-binding protein n=1 Tax=Photobacterium damselae TaxID=38293 RepID=UPI002542E023
MFKIYLSSLRYYLLHITISLFLLINSPSSYAARLITDQLGRTVEIPENVDRVVVLQHQTLNILNQLDALNKVVGIQRSWKKQLGEEYIHLAPSLVAMPTPGDLTQVNIESLLATNPQVVFVANYAPAEMIKQIVNEGIPVIAISLRHAPDAERNKLNPTLKDDESAYDQGLIEGIQLIATVVNKSQQGKALIDATFAQQNQLKQRLAAIKPSQRIRVYMANPDLNTYGSGKYTGVMMARAGGNNVAASTLKGYHQVAMEQILTWNPQVIFVQHRFPDVITEIKHDPNFKWVNAVKNQRVYLMPEYAKAWGYPMPEAIALGEWWMAKTLYPQLFKDIDLNEKIQRYYHQFYRTTYI